MSESCGCCRIELPEDRSLRYIMYENARLNSGIGGDEIEFGRLLTLCRACGEGHSGVMRVARRRERIRQAVVQAEIMNQEFTPTDEGFYKPLASAFTLYVDPTELGTAQAILMAGGERKGARPALNEVTITAEPIEHFENGEWALVPV